MLVQRRGVELTYLLVEVEEAVQEVLQVEAVLQEVLQVEAVVVEAVKEL